MLSFDIAGYHVRGLLAGLSRLGLDVQPLLAQCRIDHAMLADTERRFAAQQMLMLWLNAEQRYGKPSFGFDLATRIPLGKLELIDYLAAACPTIGDGLTCLEHHARLCASGYTYRLERCTHEGIPGFRMRTDQGTPIALLSPSMAEYAWTSIIIRFRRGCSDAFRPVLWLRRKVQATAPELFAELGRIPELGEEEALFVPETQWLLENPRGDPMLYGLLSAHARDVVSRLPADDILSAVRGAMAAAVQRGDPSIGRVAQQLGLGPRTLQRRLEADGLAYQELLDGVRHELAVRYLESTQLSIAEISALLAYADASAFGRAFRRWTGDTPAAYRQRRRHEPALQSAE